ncbi:hypothetical protein R50072_10650 [Simiduia litorea]|uniref:hypothetical protein n=1 Tax=Simiduia litorea TaxID=1435348 RepID=UPI0036F1B5BA
MNTSNANTPIKELVREKIAEVSLSDAQIDALNAHLNPPLPQKKPWSNLMIAAGFVLFMGLGLMAHTQWQAWKKEQLFIAIAQEVVDNHLKQRPLEFQDQDLAGLDSHFTELNFTLVNSIQLPHLHTELLGGRYCSIQGVTAAQLRLQNDNAQVSSLYQVPFTAALFSTLGNINVDEQPVLRYAKGFAVTLWEEKGVLMVLVQSPNTELTPIVKPELPTLVPPPSLTP